MTARSEPTIDSRAAGPGRPLLRAPGRARRRRPPSRRRALRAGAWGVLVRPEHEAGLAGPAGSSPATTRCARSSGWRARGGVSSAAQVVGHHGLDREDVGQGHRPALLPRRVHASPENFNTEIGLPLTILSAPPETEVLVLEMAMRGLGQIAELCEIAEPDVAAITNVGPVHLELLGTLEAIAEAKAEILAGPGGGRDRRHPRRRRGARAPPPRRSGDADLRPWRRRHRSRRRALRRRHRCSDRNAGRRSDLRAAVRRGPQPPERPLRDRHRHRPGLRGCRDGPPGSGDRVLAAARRARAARRRDRDRERLLQRQPDLHARGAREPCDGRRGGGARGATDRGAGRDEGAGTATPPATTARSGRWPGTWASTR